MTLPRSAADVLSGHVVFEVESIDRMYLNVWQPRLQHGAGAAAFFTSHRGHAYASTALMDPMTKAFVADIHHFIASAGVDLVHFGKERKDEVTQRYLAGFTGTEGVLYAGRAQEKATVWRTQRRYHPDGSSYAWLVKTSALVNFFYFYCVDADFGPFFIKFCTYFPYTAKLCINGHEWAKRQAARAGIGFEALDNGFASCQDPARCRPSATGSARPTSTPCCASGCASCRTRSPPMTSPPATATSCPSCRPSSPSPTSWTHRPPGGSSSSRSSGTTSTSAARTRSRWSSPAGSSARAASPRRAGSAPGSSPTGWSRACTPTTSTPRSSSTTSSAGRSGPRPPSTTLPPTSASPSG